MHALVYERVETNSYLFPIRFSYLPAPFPRSTAPSVAQKFAKFARVFVFELCASELTAVEDLFYILISTR